MNVENLLFIDTETNEYTQEVDCITYLIGNKQGIIEEFNEETYKFLRDLWHFSDGVVFFNAPFDMGVLAKAYIYNGFKWVEEINPETEVKTSVWDMLLFGHRYKLKKLTMSANLVYPLNRKHPVPIIDLMKLWALLIQPGDPGVGLALKKLIKKHLDWDPIDYSFENAKTDEYRYQDVIAPKELMYIFLDKIKDVGRLNTFTADEWGSIKSSASFSKIFYQREYENLKDWQEDNDKEVSKFKLSASLEKAFHGGMTFAFYRGSVEDCAWVDIKGAYANAMIYMNTDRYLKFKIERVDSFDLKDPYLLYVKSNFVIDTIEDGLKTFYVHEECKNWVWNFDIASIENMIPDFKYEIIEIYKMLPDLDIKQSLPGIWNEAKNIEQKENGKSTLYNFYKLLSNSSYGIKAQRIPSRTIHTNMVIAGMITSRAHLILTTINRIIKEHGHELMYNDTDSACFHFENQSSLCDLDENFGKDPFDLSLIDVINKAIAPFEVDYEGVFFDNRFLSLKRYVSSQADEYRDTNLKIMGEVPHDKIRVHGKGAYDLTETEMYNAAMEPDKIIEDRLLNTKQLGGTTERTLKRIISLFPDFEPEIRPFMFVKNIKSDTYVSTFLKKWVNHVDRKLTVKFGKQERYSRTFKKFNNRNAALLFYKNMKKPERPIYGGNMTDTFIFYDALEKELSDESIQKIEETTISCIQIPKSIDGIILHYCEKCGIGLVVGKTISEKRYKKKDFVCKNCYIRKPKSPNRKRNVIVKEKKDKKATTLKTINKITVKNQDQTMREMEQEVKRQRKDNNKRIKDIKKRLNDKEEQYQKKKDIRKKKQNDKKKIPGSKKVKIDEKKFCKDCGVLLNPFIDGNISRRNYKERRYLCIECNAKILIEKRIMKNGA